MFFFFVIHNKFNRRINFGSNSEEKTFVMNVFHKFKITKPVSEYINKYHKVYGYYWNDHYNEWSKRSSEIYYAQYPAWIVEWFRTKKETELYRNSYK